MKLTLKIQDALDTAARAHRFQVRKDGQTPYITHPFGVAVILGNYSEDEDLIIAGLLHDVLEDVPDQYSEEQMRKDFGDRVVEIVLGVTEDKSIQDWNERKQEYRDNLQKASIDSVMLSCADLTHNLTAMMGDIHRFGPSFLDKFASDNESRIRSYELRYEIIEKRLNGPIVAGLKAVLDEYVDLIKEIEQAPGS